MKASTTADRAHSKFHPYFNSSEKPQHAMKSSSTKPSVRPFVNNTRPVQPREPSPEDQFTYPCKAFKQFLLAMQHNVEDLDSIANSKALNEYLNYHERSRQHDNISFENSLRSGSASKSPRNRVSSAGNRNSSMDKYRDSDAKSTPQKQSKYDQSGTNYYFLGT